MGTRHLALDQRLLDELADLIDQPTLEAALGRLPNGGNLGLR